MDLTYSEVVFRIILASVLSALIGLERFVHGKPAGIRTHALAGMGAAVMTLCGVLIAQQYRDIENAVVDPTRLASIVIQGIGFIGAGVIIQSRGFVKGLTSAATLWFVAAIGISMGFGFWQIALTATLLGLVYLVIFRGFEDEAERLEAAHSQKEHLGLFGHAFSVNDRVKSKGLDKKGKIGKNTGNRE